LSSLPDGGMQTQTQKPRGVRGMQRTRWNPKRIITAPYRATEDGGHAMILVWALRGGSGVFRRIGLDRGCESGAGVAHEGEGRNCKSRAS
jgi:hypothetical protein